MILLVLCILAIIASWMFQLPTAWSVTLTVFASLGIVELVCYWLKD